MQAQTTGSALPKIVLSGERLRVASASVNPGGARAAIDGDQGTDWTVSGGWPQELVLELLEVYEITVRRYVHGSSNNYLAGGGSMPPPAAPACNTKGTGKIYYVAPNGSGTCSSATSESGAVGSIATGLKCLQGGDTLVIKGGTYPETIRLKKAPNGSDAAYTTIKAADGEQVWLRPPAGLGCVIVNDAPSSHHLKLERVGIDGATLGTKSCTGLRIGGHDNIFDGIEIKNINGRNADAVTTEDTSYSNVFRNMYIHDLGDAGMNANPNLGFYMHGSKVIGKPNIVENNLIEGVDCGVNIRHCASGGRARRDGTPLGTCFGFIHVIVRGNIIRNSGTGICNHNSASESEVYNNIILNTHKGLFLTGDSRGYAKPLKIYNNTFYNISEAGLTGARRTHQESLYNDRIKNNIFYKVGHPEWVPPGNFTGDPGFVNPSRGNLCLKADSPVIDKGVTLAEVRDDFAGTSRLQSGAYDLGAYEYSASCKPGVGASFSSGSGGCGPGSGEAWREYLRRLVE